MNKLQEQLLKLKSLKADQNLIDWMEYKIEMKEGGSYQYVPMDIDHTGGYAEVVLTQTWVSAEISYEGFMGWKIDRLLNLSE